jgi:hypothetical protein
MASEKTLPTNNAQLTDTACINAEKLSAGELWFCSPIAKEAIKVEFRALRDRKSSIGIHTASPPEDKARRAAFFAALEEAFPPPGRSFYTALLAAQKRQIIPENELMYRELNDNITAATAERPIFSMSPNGRIVRSI